MCPRPKLVHHRRPCARRRAGDVGDAGASFVDRDPETPGFRLAHDRKIRAGVHDVGARALADRHRDEQVAPIDPVADRRPLPGDDRLIGVLGERPEEPARVLQAVIARIGREERVDLGERAAKCPAR